VRNCDLIEGGGFRRRLVGLSDEKALAKLPKAEQEAWRQLWADVAAFLKRTAEEK